MTAMTVRRLVLQLKKMPQTAYVAWQNHEQSDHEIDGLVGRVGLAEPTFYEHPESQSRTEWLDGRKIVVLGP
ncbi:hypothetical protein LB517_27920 [Mesorhizobium sp. BR1-1-12]|uniref:hypothetical protein n=1 Tax=Mesorhizobium sp. BR1-1-12 TaxID=2876657 RepID=UPI001CD0EDD1|nr:hypothetical protein [Mesorhizobium sp. BR1-1-12]MBZ9973461.1 hypothetical protein [Mesorhizobium sp. BR1-1-12]